MAEHSGDSQLDDLAPPIALHVRQSKSRYPGWPLAAYLMPPAVALTGLAAESGTTVLAAGVWLHHLDGHAAMPVLASAHAVYGA